MSEHCSFRIGGPARVLAIPSDVTSLSKICYLLKKHKNIAGIKDTQAGMANTIDLVKRVKSQYPDFEVFSGFDDNFAHNVLSGGDGCIAGLSNVTPKLCHAWVQAFADND